jgi:hypothetical protein
MANWRVLIIVAVAIALGFWAGVIAQQQQDNASHSVSAAYQRVTGGFLCDRARQSRWQNSGTHHFYSTKADCVASVGSPYTLRDRLGDWLLFLGVAAVALHQPGTSLVPHHERCLRLLRFPADLDRDLDHPNGRTTRAGSGTTARTGNAVKSSSDPSVQQTGVAHAARVLC